MVINTDQPVIFFRSQVKFIYVTALKDNLPNGLHLSLVEPEFIPAPINENISDLILRSISSRPKTGSKSLLFGAQRIGTSLFNWKSSAEKKKSAILEGISSSLNVAPGGCKRWLKRGKNRVQGDTVMGLMGRRRMMRWWDRRRRSTMGCGCMIRG